MKVRKMLFASFLSLCFRLSYKVLGNASKEQGMHNVGVP
jgi:hypothetical protein